MALILLRVEILEVLETFGACCRPTILVLESGNSIGERWRLYLSELVTRDGLSSLFLFLFLHVVNSSLLVLSNELTKGDVCSLFDNLMSAHEVEFHFISC